MSKIIKIEQLFLNL